MGKSLAVILVDTALLIIVKLIYLLDQHKCIFMKKYIFIKLLKNEASGDLTFTMSFIGDVNG